MDLRLGGARSILRTILNATKRPVPLALIRLLVKFEPEVLPQERPDVIISSGGRTMYLNAVLARQMRCRNFFTGTLRGLRDDYFTATILPFELPDTRRNIVVELPLSDIEPSEVKLAGEQLRQALDLGDEKLWTILVGGNGAGCHYGDDDWKALGRAISDLSREHRIRWLIATSRRTTSGGESLLRKEIPSSAIADAAWYSVDPRKVVQAYLGAASMAFCTEDSMSMIGEAVTAGIPVYSLSPRKAKIEDGNRVIIESLQKNRRIQRLSITDMARAGSLLSKEAFEVFRDSPAQTLAEKLRPYFSGSNP